MDAEIKYTNPSPQYCQEIVWSGSEEMIFKRFYKENNSLKYCNGCFYTFKDANLEREYKTWLTSLSKATRFKMYYGNGVVD
jgi:hypothetical protein